MQVYKYVWLCPQLVHLETPQGITASQMHYKCLNQRAEQLAPAGQLPCFALVPRLQLPCLSNLAVLTGQQQRLIEQDQYELPKCSFSFHSIFEMALSGILTEAEIAAGLQSCQGNIYVLNLAFHFIYQIILSPPPQHSNSNRNKKG